MKNLSKIIKIPKKISLNQIKEYFKKYKLFNKIENNNLFPPNLIDLYRIHQFIILNNRTSVLEFGCGWSSMIILHALNENLKKNKIIDSLKYEFEIFENGKKYLNHCKKRNNKIKNNKIKTKYIYSKCHWIEFNNRISSSYNRIPLINPNFIYLDGPDPSSVLFKNQKLKKNKNADLMPMSCDILKIEYNLIPGTIILIDGRTNNANFLKNNFKRNWLYFHDLENDQSIFYLNDLPLGVRNINQLKFFKKKYK